MIRIFCSFFCRQFEIVAAREKQSLLEAAAAREKQSLLGRQSKSKAQLDLREELARGVKKDVARYIAGRKEKNQIELICCRPTKQPLSYSELRADFEKKNEHYLQIKEEYNNRNRAKDDSTEYRKGQSYVQASDDAYTAFNLMRVTRAEIEATEAEPKTPHFSP